MLYGTAIGTGLRASELASLHPASFDLQTDSPVVHVEAGYSKNRKPVIQPLPSDLANALREYLASKPADQAVWPGTWPEKASKMIRLDLEACGIAYRDDAGLVADFHSLRHCFVALLDRAGVSLKQAMQLARHSDPKLTMARYGRAQLHDLAAAVESLPALMPPDKGRESLRATGTTGRPADLACTTACTKLAQTADSACDTLRLPERENPLKIQQEFTTPGRIRTCDLRFRKPSLYPLSYGGMRLANGAASDSCNIPGA
jgi:Phage integrase family